MISNRTLRSPVLSKLYINAIREYTVTVERSVSVPLMKKNIDTRQYPLKSRHFRYKMVECEHVKKWGNVDLILTDYVEGVGHKGEIINLPRHQAYYELLPCRLAVYPTRENLDLYKEDREKAALKPKVSPYAIKTKEFLDNMILKIPMNMDQDWVLNADHIRLALRYNKVVCEIDSIILPANLDVTNKSVESQFDNFFVTIKVNDYLSAYLKCKIVPLDTNKLWETFVAFNKTV